VTLAQDDREGSLDEAQFRSMIDFSQLDTTPLPPISPPLMSTPLHTHDHAEENRRIKRRKLDPDRQPSTFKGFRYGRYGQVEPGQLTMEIVYCDGGIYGESTSYAAENILKNDSTVYCTKGNRCNIILSHQGATAFSLKELVIKGPANNYSAP
jgi:hypothetical protein